jgi:hypothetical protein
MREKRGLFIVLVGVFLVLLSFSVLAEEGCFLYPSGDESLYCQTGTLREEAEVVCGEYDDCDMATHFASRPCTIADGCREVKCSVDCDFHMLGWCEQLGITVGETDTLAGREVLPADEAYWCEERCCAAGPYCSNGPVTRWDCQAGAFRAGVSETTLQEDSSILNPAACTTWCGASIEDGSLSGVVKDQDGNLLANARISFDTGQTAISGSDGTYSFTALPPRTYVATVSLDEYATSSTTILIEAGLPSTHDFTLYPPGEFVISGTVDPVSATISWVGPTTGVVIADSSGYYEISAVTPGEYTVTASKSGYASQDAPVTILATSQTQDFTLVAAEFLGLEGITYVNGIATGGVAIFVDGITKGFSSYPDGLYQITLIPGTYDVSAVFREFSTSEPAQITLEDLTVTHILNLYTTTPECGPDNYQAVESLSGFPTLGEESLTITWVKPCDEVVEYAINRFFCSDGVNCDAEPEDEFTAGPLHQQKIDDDVSWGMWYRYEVTAMYDEGQSETLSTEIIFVGDPECERKYDAALGWSRFCIVDDFASAENERQRVWTCQNNQLLAQENCGLSGSYCSPAGELSATCKSANSCTVWDQQATPFGLYYDRSTCYGSDLPETGTENYCYFDYTGTIVNQCNSCADVTSCTDYLSEDACGINNCLTQECSWVQAADDSLLDYELLFPDLDLPQFVTAETGKGYCGDSTYEGDEFCSLCGPNASIFSNTYCTAEVCSTLGNCLAQQDFQSCTACGEESTKDVNCYTYQTELECTNYLGGTTSASGHITLSEDQCGWGRCAWSGTPGGEGNCIKDGNADAIDDCAEIPGHEYNACTADTLPPTTLAGSTGVLSFATPNVTFIGTDASSLGKLFYCLLPTTSTASTYCDETQLTENAVEFSELETESSLIIDVLQSLDQNVNGETYRLQYFSEDRYSNQEDIQEEFFIVDNVVPEFSLGSTFDTIGDQTDLDVFLDGELEEMSCDFSLLPIFPIDSEIVETRGAEEEHLVTFSALDGIHYNLSVTCTDAYGNKNLKSEWFTFDLEQYVTLVYPEVGDVIATTRVSFQVETDVASFCQLRTVVDDQIVADFIPDTEWKVHETAPISGLTERAYYNTYKVVCTESLTGEVREDYFSFRIDFTPPSVQIILTEGVDVREPTALDWEETFVESVSVDFRCIEDGASCAQTFYCLGDACPLTDQTTYTEYTGTIAMNDSSRICYYSTDETGNQAFPLCGTILIEGYGLTLLHPPGYIYAGTHWGVSNQPKFDVEFYTKVPTTECRFDFTPGFSYTTVPLYKVLTPNADGIYSIDNFPESAFTEFSDGGSSKALYFVCTGLEGKLSPEQLVYLEYDPTAPTILDAFATPDPVAEGISTNLFAETDDKTICRFSDASDGSGSAEYATMEYSFTEKENLLQIDHQVEFSISFVGESKDYMLNVQCLNGASDVSPVEQLTFSVDYSLLGNIVGMAPEGYVSDTNVTLEVQTNKNARCTYWDGLLYRDMAGGGGTYHTALVSGLIEGEKIYPLKCVMGDHQVEEQLIFTVDRTPPEITEINDNTRTCSLTQMTAFITTQDAGEIGLFSYKVCEKNANVTRTGFSTTDSCDDPLANGTSASNEAINITGLNLTEGTDYYLVVQAMDAAGNWGLPEESNGVEASSANHTLCESDDESAIVNLAAGNSTCTSVSVQITYNDSNGVASIKYGIHPTSSLCEPTISYAGGGITIEQSAYICYEVTDVMGNVHPDSKLISFPDRDGDNIANSCDLCPGTAQGKVADAQGCADGQVPSGDRTTDTDRDSLPDFWEKRYDTATCALNYLSPDTNQDSIKDSEEDYDGDGLNTYEEYIGNKHPCLADAPEPTTTSTPTLPPPPSTSDGPDIVAWVLLIIGLLCVSLGTGYLVYYYKSSPQSKVRSVTPLVRTPTQKAKPKPSMVAQWKQKLADIRRVREQKRKSHTRHSLFGAFSKSSKEIPHLEAALHKSAPHLNRLHDLAHAYVDHKAQIQPGLQKHEKGIFAKLESIAGKTQDKHTSEIVSKKQAQDIFAKLKTISEQRKKQ